MVLERKCRLNNLDEEVVFSSGAKMKNRFMLAPLTNTQSHEDGLLSDEEFHWLTMRAEGSFGITMTCATHTQAYGKGFPGQLGIFGDEHIDGHGRLATAIKNENSLAVLQLHHAGIRSPSDLINGTPLGPSADEETGARALSLGEVEVLRDDFVRSAERAKEAGYDGVEVHGAHGYIICAFLSTLTNRRDDVYGGSLDNRARLLFEIVNGIRETCGDNFLIGVRLSPERFGMDLGEIKIICQRLINSGEIDFLDISLWDSFKDANDPKYQEKKLLEHFTDLDMKEVKLTVAGNIRTAEDVRTVIDAGVDFVTIGRAAILHHDFPQRVLADDNFVPISLPASRDYLGKEGLSPNFIQYMTRWEGFVGS